MLYSANRCFVFLCFLIFSLTALTLPQPALAGGSKVEVCHIPPDDPDNFHTIRIGSKALNAHLNHLDLAGACDGLCAALCDDGDACTIDDTANCEEAGCPAVPELVDCDDGDLCTIDSCDSLLGCENDPVVCNPIDACHVAACDPLDGSCLQTEITCPEGYICDPVEGCIEDEPEPVEPCPCFELADLQNEGSVDACSSAGSDPFVAQFINNALYCSGFGCVHDQDNQPAVGCSVFREFNGSGWDDISGDFATSEGDQTCKNLMQAVCPSSSPEPESMPEMPMPEG
ncbi:MAG: hypothetical protein HKN15_10935 [Xanthomonadales bacterium]|nr:hypothetical protein [Xanthomonadales bacterium]